MDNNEEAPYQNNPGFGLYDCCALEVELGWSRQDAFAYSNKGRLAAKPSPGDAGDGWEGNTRKKRRKRQVQERKTAGSRDKRLQGGG